MAVGGGIAGLIIYLLVSFLGGGESAGLAEQFTGPAQASSPEGVVSTGNAADDEMAQFVSVVLADNEDVWNRLFSEHGSDYREPVMVLYRDRTASACGSAQSAVGPFYCPADQKIYLDLSFFEDLKNRFGAAGDFASAYVIAHEVGHHVQQLMGTSEKVQRAMQSRSKTEANKLSVALELQADFYAGVWAHHNQQTKQVLEPGDIEEALGAANAIGDDRLQKMTTGEVVPDAFTHGTSEQRMHWFRKGYQTGDLRQGDTFIEMR